MTITILAQPAVQPKHRSEAAKIIAQRLSGGFSIDWTNWSDPRAALVARSLQDGRGPYAHEIRIVAEALAKADAYSEIPF